MNYITEEVAFGMYFFLFLVVVLGSASACKWSKKADELEPFAVVIYDPDAPAEDLGIPAFLRYQDEDDELIEEWETRLPRPRKERE